jgi:Protein of unknown function (DUF2786)
MTIEREKILTKIRGLVTKTIEAGCTEAEAMAALDRARAMMDAYQVTEAELNLTKEEKAILRREPPGTKDPHKIKWACCGLSPDFAIAEAGANAGPMVGAWCSAVCHRMHNMRRGCSTA